MWCPHTMHPSNAIMNKATNIASLENIIEWVNLEITSLIKPNPGRIRT
jgi:hypothetical protein